MRLVNIDAAQFRGTTATKHRGTLAGALRNTGAANATNGGDTSVSADNPPEVIAHEENLVEIWRSLFRDARISSQWRICDEPILLILVLNMAAMYNGLKSGSAPSTNTQNNIAKMCDRLGMHPAARTHIKLVKSDGTLAGSEESNRFADIENIA